MLHPTDKQSGKWAQHDMNAPQRHTFPPPPNIDRGQDVHFLLLQQASLCCSFKKRWSLVEPLSPWTVTCFERSMALLNVVVMALLIKAAAKNQQSAGAAWSTAEAVWFASSIDYAAGHQTSLHRLAEYFCRGVMLADPHYSKSLLGAKRVGGGGGGFSAFFAFPSFPVF